MKTNFEEFLSELNLQAFARGNPELEDIDALASIWQCETYKLNILNEEVLDSEYECVYSFGEFINCMYKFYHNVLTNESNFEVVDIEQL